MEKKSKNKDQNVEEYDLFQIQHRSLQAIFSFTKL